MLDRFDQLELLALIEGELDARAEAALRRRIAAEDGALEVIDRLCRDRAALRAVPEPETPVDFLARLEPMLARPMLMEPVSSRAQNATRPGEFRRLHRKRTRRIRWTRLGALSAFVLIVFVSGWYAVSRLLLGSARPNGSASLVAKEPSPSIAGEPNPGGVALVDVQPDWSPQDGTIHHDRPLPLPSMDDRPGLAAAGAAAPDGLAGANGSTAAAARTVVAEFAVVVQTADPAHAELTLQHLIAAQGERGALSRNFSFADAKRLAEEWRVAQMRAASRGEPAAASATLGRDPEEWRTPAQLKILADRIRQRLSTGGAPTTADGAALADTAAPLAGAAQLAPPLEQQLELSSRGATHTVAMPASELASFIERLNASDGQTTTLRMLPPRNGWQQPAAPVSENTEAWQPLLLWITEGPQVRQAYQIVSQAPRGTVVFVPVIVRAEPSKHPHAIASPR